MTLVWLFKAAYATRRGSANSRDQAALQQPPNPRRNLQQEMMKPGLRAGGTSQSCTAVRSCCWDSGIWFSGGWSHLRDAIANQSPGLHMLQDFPFHFPEGRYLLRPKGEVQAQHYGTQLRFRIRASFPSLSCTRNISSAEKPPNPPATWIKGTLPHG